MFESVERKNSKAKQNGENAKGIRNTLFPVIQYATSITYRYKNYKCGVKGDERVGAEMEAELDPADPRYGSRTDEDTHKDLIKKLREKRRKTFIKGHLLNHDLGGLSVCENLFPITSSANGLHSYNVEDGIKKILGGGKIISYKVKVDSKFDMDIDDEDELECKIKCKDSATSAWGKEYTEKIESKLYGNGGSLKSTSGFKAYADTFTKANPWVHKARGKKEHKEIRSAISSGHNKYEATHVAGGTAIVKNYANLEQKL